jgi:hypothetical protein
VHQFRRRRAQDYGETGTATIVRVLDSGILNTSRRHWEVIYNRALMFPRTMVMDFCINWTQTSLSDPGLHFTIQSFGSLTVGSIACCSTCLPARLQYVQGTFRKHSRNIPRTFKHPGNIQGTPVYQQDCNSATSKDTSLAQVNLDSPARVQWRGENNVVRIAHHTENISTVQWW